MKYDGELAILELGERAETCLFAEAFSVLYDREQDHAWSLVLSMYGFICIQAPNQEERWKPHLDEHGQWVGRHWTWSDDE